MELLIIKMQQAGFGFWGYFIIIFLFLLVKQSMTKKEGESNGTVDDENQVDSEEETTNKID